MLESILKVHDLSFNSEEQEDLRCADPKSLYLDRDSSAGSKDSTESPSAISYYSHRFSTSSGSDDSLNFQTKTGNVEMEEEEDDDLACDTTDLLVTDSEGSGEEMQPNFSQGIQKGNRNNSSTVSKADSCCEGDDAICDCDYSATTGNYEIMIVVPPHVSPKPKTVPPRKTAHKPSKVHTARKAHKPEVKRKRELSAEKKIQRYKPKVAKPVTYRRFSHRSTSGCWVCRLKHKKCDETRPRCRNCAVQHMVCDYSEQKPLYFTDVGLRREKLDELNRIWLGRYKLLKIMKGDKSIPVGPFLKNRSYDTQTRKLLEQRNKRC